MFASYVADTVVAYCFENRYNWLEAPDFYCGFAEAMNSLLDNVHLVTQFPWVARILSALPDNLLAKLNPDMNVVNGFNKEMRRQISHILENPQLESKDSRRKTVFKALLESDLPPQELSPLRLQHEATTIIGAGVETTRWALSVGCFHILNTPAIFQRLRKELEEAIPDPDEMPSLEKLEQLPYLAACIEEYLSRVLYIQTRALAGQPPSAGWEAIE
ncbi:MAG: hypothetical protein LQ340_004868 [Diploschistes diacapsis]|nr:MAG: hypothetical protein LQ340_004868 [Diploschistes diacapsis]